MSKFNGLLNSLPIESTALDSVLAELFRSTASLRLGMAQNFTYFQKYLGNDGNK